MKEAGTTAITAFGACTSLGSATHAAAAARAGLVRIEEIPGLSYTDEETNEEALLTGHPISGITDGFAQSGRLVRIGVAAMADLLASATWINPRRTALYLAFSPIARPLSDSDDDDDDDEGFGRSAPAAPGLSAEELARRVADGICSASGLELNPMSVSCYVEGRHGASRALHDATDALQRGRCDFAIVGGIDSELDPSRIDRSLASERVKTAQNPVGFLPGEAGVFALLERIETLRGQGRGAEALIAQMSTATEPENFAAGKVPTGKGLSEVAALALTRAGGASEPHGTVYIDLNGEPHRAMDWGSALVRLHGKCSVDAWAQSYPAASFGEVGAAYPLLASFLAARALSRGYARGSIALVLASCDEGGRAAIVLRRMRAGAG